MHNGCNIFTYIIYTDYRQNVYGPCTTGETVDGVDGSPVTPQQRFVDANDLFEGHLAGGNFIWEKTHIYMITI
jgi:hypothetical protein